MIRLARTIWYVLTLRCEEADRVRSVDRMEDLTRAERFGTWAHTSLCRSCRKARRQARALQRVLREVGDGLADGELPEIPDSTRTRILDSIDKKLS